MDDSWRDRTVRGPVAEQLTPEQFCTLFGLTEEFYEERIREGAIPPPLRYSAKKQFHPWQHVVYFDIWRTYMLGKTEKK